MNEPAIAAPIDRLIRTRRRTMALTVRPDGALWVRAPLHARDSAILGFIRAHARWIERTRERLMRRRLAAGPPAYQPHEIPRLKREALERAGQRCPEFAARMGVRYARIGLSNARTRWGSCSPRGHLRFNWRLAAAPADVFDYVVVHELAHLKEPNHSPRFWAIVSGILPDHAGAKAWLREHALGLQLP